MTFMFVVLENQFGTEMGVQLPSNYTFTFLAKFSVLIAVKQIKIFFQFFVQIVLARSELSFVCTKRSIFLVFQRRQSNEDANRDIIFDFDRSPPDFEIHIEKPEPGWPELLTVSHHSLVTLQRQSSIFLQSFNKLQHK